MRNWFDFCPDDPMCIFSSFCCGGKPLIRASICRSARVAAREGRNAFGKWDDPNSTNLYSQPTQPSSKKFSKPYTELITSVIAKTEIVWATRLSSCSRLQLVNWTTIWGHSGKELPRDTACCFSKLTPQGLTAKYWHKSISSKYAPVIDFAAGLTTYFQVYFLKNLNHQFP